MNFNRPKRAYLDIADPKRRMEFQYNPIKIDDEKGAEYTTSHGVGTSHGVPQFSHGKERTLKFDLILDVFKRTESNRPPGDVEEKIKILRALEYPRKGDGLIKRSPSKVIFTMGRLVVYGVVKSASVHIETWDHRLNIMRAMVSLEIQEVPLKASINNEDILGNAMFVSTGADKAAMPIVKLNHPTPKEPKVAKHQVPKHKPKTGHKSSHGKPHHDPKPKGHPPTPPAPPPTVARTPGRGLVERGRGLS